MDQCKQLSAMCRLTIISVYFALNFDLNLQDMTYKKKVFGNIKLNNRKGFDRSEGNHLQKSLIQVFQFH